MELSIMGSSDEFWWDDSILHNSIKNLLVRDGMVMDRHISFLRPNKNVRIDKVMDHLIPQTKHPVTIRWPHIN